MRYLETREETAELLRMVLPLMSRHAAGFHPLSYAVWYEYAAGYNLGLKAAVDELIADERQLGNADIERLYDQHIALHDMDTSMHVRARIQEVIEQVSEAASQASIEVTHYGRGLTEYQHLLQQHPDKEQVAGLVDSLLSDITRVRNSTSDIQQNLSGRTQEVVRLREELHMAQGLALTDPLTGMLNRRGFEQYVDKLGEQALEQCGVLVFDIDHFKSINDTYGHLLGDRVIVAVAHVIRNSVAGKGQSARMGGEEFAAVFTSLNASTVAEMAERIRSSVEKGKIRRQDRKETIGGVTISIGAAMCLENEELGALMERADRALYKSKQDGRNRITVSTRNDN